MQSLQDFKTALLGDFQTLLNSKAILDRRFEELEAYLQTQLGQERGVVSEPVRLSSLFGDEILGLKAVDVLVTERDGQ